MSIEVIDLLIFNVFAIDFAPSSSIPLSVNGNCLNQENREDDFIHAILIDMIDLLTVNASAIDFVPSLPILLSAC